MESTVLVLMMLFQIKHFIADFPLQGPGQYRYKHIYGHPGGIRHATVHALGTMFVTVWFITIPGSIILGLLDAVIHYHVDWAKMNINIRYNLRPDNSERFWWLLGADQFCHQATYLMIIAIMVLPW